MSDVLISVALVVALFAIVAALQAWRWWLDDRKAQRAHELEVHSRRVTIDQEAIDKSMASVKRLEERVRTLEYRPK